MCEIHKSSLSDPCWYCQRGRAICKHKIRFSTWLEAEEWVDEYNKTHNYEKPLARYKCRWCQHWHMSTVKRNRQMQRAERARRKWVITKEMVRREQLTSPREDTDVKGSRHLP